MLVTSLCFGQPDFRFHNYGLAQGLPSPGIRDVVEDPSGLIWVGTNNGLASFNGYEFKVYRNTPGRPSQLLSNDVTTLLPLSNGDLLVGTSAGLHLFDHQRLTFQAFWDSLPPSYISQIVSDPRGGFWIGSSTGLYHLDSIGHQPKPHFNNAELLVNTGIFDLALDSNRVLWITTSRKGFFKFDITSNQLTNFRHDDRDPRSLSSDVMRQLELLRDGRVVVGTADAGYDVFDPKTNAFERYNHVPGDASSLSSTAAFSLLVDSKDNLWIGTWANGLNLIDIKNWKGRYFKNDPGNPYSISSNSITTLFESSNGDIWIGSSASGLSRITPREQLFHRYRHDNLRDNTLTIPYVRAVFEDADGDLWFGTNQGGLNRYHPTTDRYTVYLKPDESRESLARGSIWSISESQDRHLWLGTSRGVANLDPITGATKWIEYSNENAGPRQLSGNNVLRVLDDHRGNLWVGIYYGGLNRVDLASGIVEKLSHDPSNPRSLSSNNINDVFIDQAQRVWVGSDEGLNLMDENKKEFTRFLLDLSIFHLNEGPNGELYVGTDRGLVIFDAATGAAKFVSEEQGLQADHVNSVLVDDEGFLWLGTNHGIDRFDVSTTTFRHFDESLGLCADDTEAKSCFKSSSGRLYFGGTGGVTSFQPREVMETPPAPAVLFTNLSVFNRVVPVNDSSLLRQDVRTTERVVLAHTDYIFALEFAGLEFRHPEKVKYAYRLDGFDRDWIFTNASDRKAVYTNVPPGRYTLRVRASDIYGNFEDAFTALKITVTPPWWKTWWANIIFYGSAFAVVALVFRLRVAFIRRQNKLLEAQVVARTAEVNRQRMALQEQAEALQKANLQKSKLFSIIAHDLKSPLGSLKSLLTIIDPSILTSADLERMKNEIGSRVEVIYGAMENLLGWAYGQMEMETLQLQSVDVARVTREMVELYGPIAEKKEIVIVSTVPENSFAVADLNLLRAVLRNLISNGIKFTGVGGKIEISCRVLDQETRLEVRDSGVGMDAVQLQNLFTADKKSTLGTSGERGVGLGLQVVKDFMEKMQGRVWVESSPKQGTTFFLSLPAPAANEASRKEQLS